MAGRANCTILLVLFFLSSLAQKTNNEHARKAIICLTYDDGLETQLSTVLPQLDSAGLKGTFFLNSIQGSSRSPVVGQTPEAVLGWTNAAKNGHELANHTLFHACPEKTGWDSALAIDRYTVARMVTEVTTENALLNLLDPGRSIRAFAFPCNNFLIHDTDYVAVIQHMSLISYARGGGDSSSTIADPRQVDPMHVPAWHVWTGTTLAQLIAFAEKVKKAGGMGVYQFHGVGGQIFAISKETHRAFLAYLVAHRNDYWVTTFSDAMDVVTGQ